MYKGFEDPARIEVTPNTFKMILPNQNENRKRELGIEVVQEPRATFGSRSQIKRVLGQIERNGFMTEQEVQLLLGIKKTRTFILMKQMLEAGLIEVQGRGTGKKYLKKKPN